MLIRRLAVEYSAYKHGGIFIGDIISTIDGQSVSTLTLTEVSSIFEVNIDLTMTMYSRMNSIDDDVN